MNVIGEVIKFFDSKMTTPEMYGAFHLTFFVLAIALGILLCIIFKNPSTKTVRRVILVTTLTVIAFEIYKQLNYTFSYDGTAISANYQWYAFPFQFCSTPMYVGLMAALFNKGKVHDSMCAFLATFATFAGLGVMFYPATVFIDTIGINIQTMICHGTMISIGIFLLGSGYVRSNYKTLLKAVPVFCSFVLIAAILNEIAHLSGLLETHTFNMFFISPYCEPSLPVYSLVQGAVPFPFCLILYVIGFSAAAGAVLGLSALIRLIFIRNTKKSESVSA